MAEQSNGKKVEHHFLNVLPDLSTVEDELMRLLNDFNSKRLKQLGNKDLNETIFKKMDAVREKQERIAKSHFDADLRLTESKIEGEDKKAQSLKDVEDLTRQLEDLSKAIDDLQPILSNK